MDFNLGSASIDFGVGKVRLGIGWYPGEQWKLASVMLLEANDGWFTIFDIAVLKFAINLSIM